MSEFMRRDRTIERDVNIRVGAAHLAGTLALPERARGMVLFAHGSGSSRFSPRNRFVAEALHERELATLLMDLLERSEEGERAKAFDIALLAERFAAATDWVRRQWDRASMPIAFFGASTGAAVALRLAAQPGVDVSAVVSRGGRPDLAGDALPRVTAPTLLIVGGHDDVVLKLNREAYAALRCEKRLEIVPGATHLFEEPGALERVAQVAADWLAHWIGPSAAAGSNERKAQP